MQTTKQQKLKTSSQMILLLVSFILVAFGQPAFADWTGPLAACFGYAFFWRVLLNYPKTLSRFTIATVWFTSVQLVQLSWFISHPYIYIYGVYFLLSLWLGLQFGIIALFIRKDVLESIKNLLAISALWVILEWSRLHVLSGLSWNPVGMALAGNIYSLQFASIMGVLGLSFWVVWTNLIGLSAYLSNSKSKKLISSLWIISIIIPYLYGAFQLEINERIIKKDVLPSTFKALLVQTAFPPEECNMPRSKPRTDPIKAVIDEWKEILRIVKKFEGESFDLMVLPEFVIPFGTYAYAYPVSTVIKAFYQELGPKSIDFFPPMQYPYSTVHEETFGTVTYVNNAFWVQTLANYFDAAVIIGLEDAEDITAQNRQYYSAAQVFPPKIHYEETEDFKFPLRYEKRVLVPMGEYIPFEFCRNLAAKYGVGGSFTCGKEAKVMHFRGIAFSPSICYEETFGDIMRENKVIGSELLVNLTSDVWYPNSRLMKQHFDHARLRTVENGFPLIRSCNTGITGAIDSLGKIVAVLGGDHPEDVEWEPGALLVEVPSYTYSTLYSKLGDSFLISLCLLLISSAIFSAYRK